MILIGSSARPALSSRTAWMRRIAGSPRLTTARRRNVRWGTEGTPGTLGPSGVFLPHGLPATPHVEGGARGARGPSGRAGDLGRHRRDGRAELRAQPAAGAARPDARGAFVALGAPRRRGADRRGRELHAR